jgi:hypothetical protein
MTHVCFCLAVMGRDVIEEGPGWKVLHQILKAQVSRLQIHFIYTYIKKGLRNRYLDCAHMCKTSHEWRSQGSVHLWLSQEKGRRDDSVVLPMQLKMLFTKEKYKVRSKTQPILLTLIHARRQSGLSKWQRF